MAQSTAVFGSASAPGFSDPIHDAQTAFRAVLETLSRPGKIESLSLAITPPSPLNPASAAVCLTLLDYDTRLWTDVGTDTAAWRWLNFHTGCRFCEASQADFALITAPHRMPDLDDFPTGEEKRPEASALVIIQVEDLQAGPGLRLMGPGIASRARLAPRGLPSAFWQRRSDIVARYPLGLDLVFTCAASLASLPRTTRTEA